MWCSQFPVQHNIIPVRYSLFAHARSIRSLCVDSERTRKNTELTWEDSKYINLPQEQPENEAMTFIIDLAAKFNENVYCSSGCMVGFMVLLFYC